MGNKAVKKPVIGIHFSDPKPMGAPFGQPVFVETYTDLINYLSERGIQAVVVRGDTYRGHGIFSRYFRWSKTKQAYIRVEKTISVDLIWNRDSENLISHITDCPSLNDHELDALCRDKYKSFSEFQSFSAKTHLVQTFAEAQKTIEKNYTGKKLILKPRYGERSQGVYLIKDTELSESLYGSWRNILIQDFLDSSAGVPGYVEGPHELKV